MLATGDIIGEGVGVGPCVIATLVLTTVEYDGSIGTNTDQCGDVGYIYVFLAKVCILEQSLACAHTQCKPHNNLPL